MSRLRKLCRGRGRALALIAAASVLWLLFDMAALRLSFGEGGGGAAPREGRLRRERGEAPSQGGPDLAPEGWPGGSWIPGSRKGERLARRGGAGKRRPGGGALQTPSRENPCAAWGSPGKTWEPAAPLEKESQRGPWKGGRRPGDEAGPSWRGSTADPLCSHGRPPPGTSAGSAAPVGSQVTPGAPGVPNKEPRERKEGLLKVALGSLAGLKLPTGSKSEASPDRPSGPRTEVNLAEVKAKLRSVPDFIKGSDLPVREPAAPGAAEKPVASANVTGPLGPQPRDNAPKRVPSLGEQVVFISKDGTQTPEQKLQADGEGGNITKRPGGKDAPGMEDRSKMPPKESNVTKVATPSKTVLAGATALGEVHKVSWEDKDHVQEIHPNDSTVALVGSPRMHKVFTIDKTLTPRDPKAVGQFGRPAVVPSEKQEEAKRRWNEGNFNVYLSDLIPVDRAIEDTRPAGCSDLLVHDYLPTTSIIMCFVDEVWSTLLRSVHSVLNRSPPQFIKEIILVDDFSTKAYLKDKLDQYMSKFPKVRVLHLKERHGLIRARLAGARIAKGDVLTFLDSHVECNVGWLEPLLDRIYLNRKKVACPVIEVISDKDMSYMTVDSFQRGIFTWPMNFGWKPIPPDVIQKNKIKDTDIIRCPVMAGGLFSIDKKYFFELGTYDPGLDVWGGENMEISFKVWMCGGEIEIVPCSRVGHIFRNDNPYSFPKDRITTVERNLARVAEVWMDEYKDLFYGHGYHLVLKNLDVGNLTQQIELRKRLQCKSFKWYLENVYPDIEAPLVKASGPKASCDSVSGQKPLRQIYNVQRQEQKEFRTQSDLNASCHHNIKGINWTFDCATHNEIVNRALAKCITVRESNLAFETCDANNEHQKFNYTWLRLIQHGDLCVALTDAKGTLGLHPCDKRNNSLKWLHKSLVAFHPELMDHIVLEHLPQATCLEVDQSQKALRVNICSTSNPYQKWQFGNYYAD